LSSESDHLDSWHARFELKTLLDTSRLLIESTDLDFVLNNLLLISMGKLFATKAAIILFDPTHKKYAVRKSKGKTGFFDTQSIPLPGADSFQDAVHVPTEHPGFPDVLKENGLTGLFQIRTRAQHMGYLCIGSKATGEPFNPREIDFLENLVNISAVAIANSLLVGQLRNTNLQLDRKVQELHTLFDLSKEFNATVDREPILKIFKFALLGQMFIRSFFFVKKRGDGEPELLVMNGLKSAPDQNCLRRLLTITDSNIRVGDRLRQDIPLLNDNQIEAMVTLRLQDEFAVLGVGKRATSEAYTDSDFNFLSSLGNLALLSIQKTLLLQERIEKERIEEELSIARTIQEKLLPYPLPNVAALDLAAMNVPSQQVGGDYYDIICRGDDVYLAIADVTGKGIPASLLMANLQAMLHVLTPVTTDLGDVTGKINDIIYKNTPSDKFISFFWARYHAQERRFQYVNAGHNPPFVFRAGSDPMALSDGGMLLGALPTFSAYQQGDITLKHDDVMVLYTDGVTEALNDVDEEYGEDRLMEVITLNRALDAAGIQQAIVDDVRRFTNDRYSDDITMIVIKVR
jgi:sigma-B regulation protein RsbU (phosphoserine phosphatase)